LIEHSTTIDPRTAELEAWPLDPEQVVGDEVPEVSGLVLDTSTDGRIERGIWQHSPGLSRDTESDELFVVLTGRATIEVEDGPTLPLGPGTIGLLHAGDRTTWHVHETLRKVFQVTNP
jgi:uncharacterized protein